MKFTVKPALNITNGSEVSGAVLCSWAHNDNELSVRVADSAVKDGVSLNGVSLGVKNDRFTCVYDMSNNAARLRMNSHINVRDRTVNLVYRNALNGEGAHCLEATMDLDDNNTAGIIYDLNNFTKPDHKAMTLKYTYRNGDYELTPTYNLGSEALGVGASYTVDGENKLKAHYNVSTNDASLQWINSSGAGGGGDLSITARTNLSDSNSAKQMPALLVEKTWDMDV